jgi:hypothetical protein
MELLYFTAISIAYENASSDVGLKAEGTGIRLIVDIAAPLTLISRTPPHVGIVGRAAQLMSLD